VYAIVKAGGRQEKVAVGDTVIVDRIDAAAGATVSFPALLVVDGAAVTTDPKVLSGVKVTGEVLEEQGSKDRYLALQEQDRSPSSPGIPCATDSCKNYRHQRREVRETK
jgi:ribosomal protein L21